MPGIEGECKQVMARAEWIAILTGGDDGPHLAGTWAEYTRRLGSDDETIIIPAGEYHKTEENLRKNRRVQLMVASRQVLRSGGVGQGCTIFGEAEIQTSGELAERARANFSWARGALVVKVKGCQTQL
ncbi:MAG: pyridoxamine 5'-phosphate oxidase family protein [Chloroflexi bacterium]|nr:pyridoxamine 5'-phosphate oxidase family protein [Chloroflexota bacterium]